MDYTPHIFYGTPVNQIIYRRYADKDKKAYGHPAQFASGDLPVITKDQEPIEEVHGDHPCQSGDFKYRCRLRPDFLLQEGGGCAKPF